MILGKNSATDLETESSASNYEALEPSAGVTAQGGQRMN